MYVEELRCVRTQLSPALSSLLVTEYFSTSVLTASAA